MVHTLPDYTTKYKLTTIFAHIDTAELAARLNSINTFDRRGTTIWMDDFESSILKWETYASGTGASVSLSTDTARHGTQSVKLTTGDAWDNYAIIAIELPMQRFKRLGVEMSFTAHSYTKNIDMYCRFRHNNTMYTAELIAILTDSKLYYAKQGGGLVVLEDPFDVLRSSFAWYTWKIVVDLDKKEWVRAIAGDTEYNMEGVELWSTSSTGVDAIIPRMNHTGNGSGNATMYVDDVIITQNEP